MGKRAKNRTTVGLAIDRELLDRVNQEVARRQAAGEEMDRSKLIAEALEWLLNLSAAQVRELMEGDLENDFPEEDPYQAKPDEDE